METQHTIIEESQEEVSNDGEDREDTNGTASSCNDPLRNENCCPSKENRISLAVTNNHQDGQKHNRGRIERIQTVDSDDECYDVSDEVNMTGVFFNMSFYFFAYA